MRHSELGCIAHVYSNGHATPKTCNENKSSRSSDRLGADEQRSRAGVAHSLGTLQERRAAAVGRPELEDPILAGAIDLHAHFGPDSYPRQWDAFEVVALAQARGLRAIVLKNHFAETAGVAYLVRKYGAQGIEVFGAVTLDTPMGGLNPQAVRYMVDVTGGWGRIVWMPTHDSEHEVTYNQEQRPLVRVSRDGVLLPELSRSSRL